MENRRAEQTIAVFGLNRADLVKERDEQRLLLIGFVEEARDHLAELDELRDRPEDDPRRARVRRRLLAKLAQIKAQGQPSAPYLMMKRPIIGGLMAEIGPTLQRLGVI